MAAVSRSATERSVHRPRMHSAAGRTCDIATPVAEKRQSTIWDGSVLL
jgi:hypothetical protein